MLYFNHWSFFLDPPPPFSICLSDKETKDVQWRCGQAVPGRLLPALLNPGAKVRTPHLCSWQRTVLGQQPHTLQLCFLFFSYSLRIEAMVLKKEFLPSCSSLYTDMTILRNATKGE